MILNNRSDYNLTVAFGSCKVAVRKGESVNMDLSDDHTEIKIYVNRKSDIQFKLFPLFKASHFLEDRLILKIAFDLSFTINQGCEILDIVNCNSKCDAPVELVSVALNDYTFIEKVRYFSQEHKQIKNRFFLYEILFIFLLPLWLLGIIMGIAFNNGKLLIGAAVCLVLSLAESYKLIKSVNRLTEMKMASRLAESAKLQELAKSKDTMSYNIVKRFFG